MTKDWTGVLLGVAFLCGGCGGDGGGGKEPPALEDGVCAEETRGDVFFAGMEEQGTSISVKLVSAVPAPPRMGDNTWTLEVTRDGALLPGAELEVVPAMPDHPHGSAEVEVSDEGDGRYMAAPVNFSMPGYWETDVHVPVSDGEEVVTFAFCVE